MEILATIGRLLYDRPWRTFPIGHRIWQSRISHWRCRQRRYIVLLCSLHPPTQTCNHFLYKYIFFFTINTAYNRRKSCTQEEEEEVAYHIAVGHSIETHTSQVVIAKSFARHRRRTIVAHRWRCTHFPLSEK